jgi:hypothetical protein
MIPEFVDGINLEHMAHRCTIGEVRARFGLGPPRKKLCDQLEHFIECAKKCGFLYALIGGSFATAKPDPGDLDITWFGPPGLEAANVSKPCADLMSSNTSREQFGHDFAYIPLYEHRIAWEAQLDYWGRLYGLDSKTMKDRGTLLLELI